MTFYHLTDKEHRVLELVAVGCSDRQISRIMSIPEHTVHNQVRSVLLKLRASNRAHAVYKAYRVSLISRTRPIEIPESILDQMRQRGVTP